MKKLKLKSKELISLGFPEGEIISLLINSIKKHFKRSDRSDVINLLEDLLKNPGKYKSDPRLKIVSQKLLNPRRESPEAKEQNTAGFRLNHTIKNYVIYGLEHIEPEALNQMETAMRLPITICGALMADAHCGYGLPIGGVLATQNAVIPYGVGMDIGCRMCLSVYPTNTAILEKKRTWLREILIENTRFGQKEYFRERKEHEVLDRKEFREIKFLKDLHDKAYEQLGTSGGGNHFVEFGIAEIPAQNEFGIPGGKYLAVLSHSGSRNFGASIAQHYTRIAKTRCNLPKGAVNLAWLDLGSQEGEEYWLAMNLAGDYAKANHVVIHKKIAAALGEMPLLIVENHHNFAWKEKLADNRDAVVHRKGATPAIPGIYGVIPGSMTTQGFIVKGKGNPQSINSASHGAGRMLSRSAAKQLFTKKHMQQALEKAGVTLLGGGLDEVPMAYKDISTVMDYQKDLVDIAGSFHPKIVRMSND